MKNGRKNSTGPKSLLRWRWGKASTKEGEMKRCLLLEKSKMKNIEAEVVVLTTRTRLPMALGGRFRRNFARTTPELPWGRVILPQITRRRVLCAWPGTFVGLNGRGKASRNQYSINQSIDQSFNQSINQSFIQSINQSIDRSMDGLLSKSQTVYITKYLPAQDDILTFSPCKHKPPVCQGRMQPLLWSERHQSWGGTCARVDCEVLGGTRWRWPWRKVCRQKNNFF